MNRRGVPRHPQQSESKLRAHEERDHVQPSARRELALLQQPDRLRHGPRAAARPAAICACTGNTPQRNHYACKHRHVKANFGWQSKHSPRKRTQCLQAFARRCDSTQRLVLAASPNACPVYITGFSHRFPTLQVAVDRRSRNKVNVPLHRPRPALRRAEGTSPPSCPCPSIHSTAPAHGSATPAHQRRPVSVGSCIARAPALSQPTTVSASLAGPAGVDAAGVGAVLRRVDARRDGVLVRGGARDSGDANAIDCPWSGETRRFVTFVTEVSLYSPRLWVLLRRHTIGPSRSCSRSSARSVMP